MPAGTIDHNIGNYIWEIDINNVPELFYKSLGRVLAELHSIPSNKAMEFDLGVHTPEEARMSMKQRKLILGEFCLVRVYSMCQMYTDT